MDAHLSQYIGCSPDAVITAEIKTYSSNVNRQRMAQFNYVNTKFNNGKRKLENYSITVTVMILKLLQALTDR